MLVFLFRIMALPFDCIKNHQERLVGLLAIRLYPDGRYEFGTVEKIFMDHYENKFATFKKTNEGIGVLINLKNATHFPKRAGMAVLYPLIDIPIEIMEKDLRQNKDSKGFYLLYKNQKYECVDKIQTLEIGNWVLWTPRENTAIAGTILSIARREGVLGYEYLVEVQFNGEERKFIKLNELKRLDEGIAEWDDEQIRALVKCKVDPQVEDTTGEEAPRSDEMVSQPVAHSSKTLAHTPRGNDLPEARNDLQIDPKGSAKKYSTSDLLISLKESANYSYSNCNYFYKDKSEILQVLVAANANSKYFPGGIEWKANSCYADSSIVSLFCFFNLLDGYVFDYLRRPEYALWDSIGCFKRIFQHIVWDLRTRFFVKADLMMELRKTLIKHDTGFTDKQMDAEEFLLISFKELSLPDFFKFTNGAGDHIHQLLPAICQGASYLKKFQTVETMLCESLRNSDVRFSSVPDPVLILKLPFCDGKSMYGSKYVLPSLQLSMSEFCVDSNAMANMLDLIGIICLNANHYTAFVKVYQENILSPWLYTDSLTSRVELLTDLGEDLIKIQGSCDLCELGEGWSNSSSSFSLIHFTHVDFICRNAYICIYARPNETFV